MRVIRRAFWSARTLRVERIEEDAEGILLGPPEHSDVLSRDADGCIYANGDYGDLIVRLLNNHFAQDPQA